MAVVWVIISQTKYPARLIQSSKEAGVQTVDMPFEVSAEYLLRRTQIPDNNLKRANTRQSHRGIMFKLFWNVLECSGMFCCAILCCALLCYSVV